MLQVLRMPTTQVCQKLRGFQPQRSVTLISLVARKVAPEFRARSLVTRGAMLSKDNGLDIPAHIEISDHTHPAWREQRNQVIQDGIGRRLMANLPVAICIDIKL